MHRKTDMTSQQALDLGRHSRAHASDSYVSMTARWHVISHGTAMNHPSLSLQQRLTFES